jgi:hypothetical protein
MRIGRGNRGTWRKPAPVPLCAPQIPHDLTWARTRATAVECRRLTARGMARQRDTLYRIAKSTRTNYVSILFVNIAYFSGTCVSNTDQTFDSINCICSSFDADITSFISWLQISSIVSHFVSRCGFIREFIIAPNYVCWPEFRKCVNACYLGLTGKQR